MSIMVADDLANDMQRYTDPSAFLCCDNPDCAAPWVTHAGVVAWEQAESVPRGSCFTNRILVGCSAACLETAQGTMRPAR